MNKHTKYITIALILLLSLIFSPIGMSFAVAALPTLSVFNPTADNDKDGVTNENELLNGTDINNPLSKTQAVPPSAIQKTDVIFAIDQSNSVNTSDSAYTRFDTVLKFVYNQDVINSGTDNLRIGLVKFNEFGQRMQPLTTNNYALTSTLKTSRTRGAGASNIADGLWVAGQCFDFYTPNQQMGDNTKRRKVIVLITDGNDKSGTTMDGLQAIAANLNSRWTDLTSQTYNTITINTIALSGDNGGQALKNIAEDNSGTYYSVNSGTQNQSSYLASMLLSHLAVDTSTAPPDQGVVSAATSFPTIYQGLDYAEARRLYAATGANLLTGNYVNQATDLMIDSQGIDTFFTRTYNSDLYTQSGSLGYGWTTNLDTSITSVVFSGKVTASALNLRETANGIIKGSIYKGTIVKYLDPSYTVTDSGYTWRQVRIPDGQIGWVAINYLLDVQGIGVNYATGTQAVFEFSYNKPDGSSVYVSNQGMHERLSSSGGYYYLTFNDQTTYAYSPPSASSSGKLVQIRDKNVNGVTVTYASDKITCLTDGVNRSLSFTYDAQNRITRIDGPESSYVTYSYDANGNLASVTDSCGKTTTYDYYADATGFGRLKRIQDANGNQVIKNDYDIFGRLVRQYDANNVASYQMYKDIYMSEGSTTAPGELARYYVDANGYVTKVMFDPDSHRPLVETDPAGSTITHNYPAQYKEEITNQMGYKTTYQKDAYGNLNKFTDCNNDSIIMEYNEQNNITKKTDKKGLITTYTYYNGVRLNTVTDPMGNTTKYEYYDANPSGGIVFTGLLKTVTESRKDSSGNLVQFAVTNYKYQNGYNNRTEVIDALGNSTKETYDALGRLTSRSSPLAWGQGVYVYTSYTYDSLGRLLTERDGLGNTKKYTYDNVGNNISQTSKNGYLTKYTYDVKNQLATILDPAQNATTFKYDYSGNKVEEKDARGGFTRFTYDFRNKLVSKTDALSAQTSYEYDKAGNLITLTDPLGHSTTYSYDNLGRKSQELAPLSKKTTYSYDRNDNLTSVINWTYTTPSITTTYEYDSLNRKVQEIFGYSSGFAKDADGYYIGPRDTNGNVTGNVQTMYIYDIYTAPSGNKLSKVTIKDPLKRVSSKSYDALGHRVKEVDAKGGTKVYARDAAGNMITSADEFSYATTYQYDVLNRLVKTLDPTGGSEKFEYNRDGKLTVKTDKNGNRTSYIYDALGRLIQEVSPLVLKKSYTYDQNGNMLTRADECGYTTTYGYDTVGRLISERDPCGNTKYTAYDLAGNKISETDKNGNIISYIYDELNRLTQINNSYGIRIAFYCYDKLDNLISSIDGNKNLTTYQYNTLNRKTSVMKYGDNSVPTYTISLRYDAVGNATMTTDSLGVTDIYSYDVLNKVLSHTEQKSNGTEAITTSTIYDLKGNKVFETDGNRVGTTYIYNKLGRITQSVVAGKSTNYTYDMNGNKLTETDWLGNKYSYVYDELNRLKAVKDPYQNTIKTNVYLSNGLLSRTTDALGNVTQYGYDALGNVISIINPEVGTVSKTYDPNGNLKTQTDPNRNVTTYNYDKRSLLISVVNAKGETTSYTYDANGNMLTQSDGNGNTTRYSYNAMNKLSKMTDALSKSESYTYYANGNLKTCVDRNGVTTEYAYNSHDRLVSKKAAGQQVTYTYDANGNQLTVVDSTGTTTRTYDNQNRVKQKMVPNLGTMLITYDITSGMPLGCVAETTRDPKGGTVTRIYDRAGRLYSVKSSDGVSATYAYLANGLTQSVVYNGGAREDYTYYRNNLLKTLVNRRKNGSVLESFSYTYDAAENQTSKVDVKGTTRYEYDELGRLKKVTEPNGKITTYTFDGAGNRKSETLTVSGTSTVITYNYDKLNRLTSTSKTANNVVTETRALTYDSNGNQLSVTTQAGKSTPVSASYSYDKFNQLLTTNASGFITTNTYNGEGLRVVRIVNGTLTRYMLDGDKVLLEVSSSGAVVARNMYGNALLGRTIGTQKIQYMYNGHGDVTALLDASTGNPVGTYYYDAFGNVVEQSGTVNNSTLYAGYTYDKETGLYWLNSRFYDPKVARFLSEDTYDGSPTDPLSLNKYVYCLQNPLKYYDPTGHWAEELQLLNELYTLQSSYSNLSKADQDKAHTRANEIRSLVKQAYDYVYPGESDTYEFRDAVDEAFNGGGHSSGSSLDYTEYLMTLCQIEGERNKQLQWENSSFKQTIDLALILAPASKITGFFGLLWNAGNTLKVQELDSLPPNAKGMYNKYNSSGWNGNVSGQTPGTAAGSRFLNRDAKLPNVNSEGKPIIYREFDVNNKLPNGARDAERFVKGSDGSTYYTNDHYTTFIKIGE